MALPWHIPLEAAPEFRTKGEEPKSSLLKHLCSVKVHDNPCEEIQIGLMCDIGIDNKEPTTIQRLLASGMTVARLNLRDLEPDECAQLVQSVRQAVYNYSAELEYVYPLALVVDIHGPNIVSGDLKGGPRTTVEINQGETLRLTTDLSWRECGTAECLFVGWDHLTDLRVGDIIFIDSLTPGKIKLVVAEVGDDSIECNVAFGGTVGAKMPIRISKIPHDVEVQRVGHGDSLESVSCSHASLHNFEHVEDQVTWAIASDVDAVLVPNTQFINDIKNIRNLLEEKGKHILVFACIETIQGLDNIDAILVEADGIYLDRCILSTDLPVEKIFIAQKMVIAKCKETGKPVINKAVINEQIPTLCVTDIANLVLDGSDVLALELHYDSPLKKFAPSYDSVRMAEHCLAATAIVCKHAERIIWQPMTYGNIELMKSCLEDPTRAVCVSAVELAMRSSSVLIICMTNSGRTAKILSHASPSCPIIAVTRACHSARQLRFWRGVRALHYFEVSRGNWISEVEARIHAALDYCKAKRIVRAGDPYVVVTGSRRGAGYCDSVRLLYASSRDTIYVE